MNTGWQCPVCRRVYAPHVNECQNCAACATPRVTPDSLYPGVPLIYPHYPPGYPEAACGSAFSNPPGIEASGRNTHKVSFAATRMFGAGLSGVQVTETSH